MRLQIAIVGALTLFFGFVLAITTGAFWLGGVLLVIGGGYCAWRSWGLSGWWRTLLILAVFVVAMLASHPFGAVLEHSIGEPLGGYVSAALAAVVAGILCWLLSRPAPRRD